MKNQNETMKKLAMIYARGTAYAIRCATHAVSDVYQIIRLEEKNQAKIEKPRFAKKRAGEERI